MVQLLLYVYTQALPYIRQRSVNLILDPNNSQPMYQGCIQRFTASSVLASEHKQQERERGNDKMPEQDNSRNKDESATRVPSAADQWIVASNYLL